jgi:hypothetical protein
LEITAPDPCRNLSHRSVYIGKALKPNKNLDSMARMNTKLIGLTLAVLSLQAQLVSRRIRKWALGS